MNKGRKLVGGKRTCKINKDENCSVGKHNINTSWDGFHSNESTNYTNQRNFLSPFYLSRVLFDYIRQLLRYYIIVLVNFCERDRLKLTKSKIFYTLKKDCKKMLKWHGVKIIKITYINIIDSSIIVFSAIIYHQYYNITI